MSQKPRCPGCDRIFNRPSGLSQHLAQAARGGPQSNPLCKAAYYPLPQVSSGTEELAQEPTNPPDDSSQPFQTFAGDLFGQDYGAADFGDDMDIDNDPPPSGMPGLETDDEDEDEVDDEDAEIDAQLFDELNAALWEPAVNPNAPVDGLRMDAAANTNSAPSDPPSPAAPSRLQSTRLNTDPIIVPFPLATAGAPISQSRSRSTYESQRPSADTQDSTNIWAPFQSKIDWTMAYWAKMRGPSSTAVTELFQMDEVPERLGLSYHTVNQLNKIIDEQLPGRPKFKSEQVFVGGEALDLYYRDI
ncbi:hypothetical protein OF83DRAFT_1179699, partial [Amylostereum chailletii]